MHYTESIRVSELGLPANLKLCLATMLAMSPAWDHGLQIAAAVETAALIALLIADWLGDGDVLPRWFIFFTAIVFCLIILILAGTAFYPLTGKFATFLHWHAIVLSLFFFSAGSVSVYAHYKDISKDKEISRIFFVALTLDLIIAFVLWVLGFH